MSGATVELISRIALKWIEKRPFSREAKARRKANRAARRAAPHPDEAAGEFFQPDQETNVDIQAFIVQAIMAAVRHGLTAAGAVSVLGSEQQMAQIAGVVAIVVGGAWSLWRKWKPAKSA